MNMETISVIEIDYEGNLRPLKEYKFQYLPRIDERIILSVSDGEQNAYKVLDVHHTPNEGTTIYVGYNGTLKSIIRSIVSKMT